jgi:hypothetical protein
MSAEPEFDPFAELRERNPEALLADGFEKAYIGYVENFNESAVAVYSRYRCIVILMMRDGMNYEDAMEFFDFNVAGAYVGKYTPLFLEDLQKQ